jgi:hypothetical protein
MGVVNVRADGTMTGMRRKGKGLVSFDSCLAMWLEYLWLFLD